MSNQNYKKTTRYFVNHQIRSRQVRCIDENNVNIGVVPIKQAFDLAINAGLDLVQISNDPETPICKIIDYSKFKYDLSKKDKEARKKQRESAVKIKEIKFRPTTEDNDLRTKAKHAADFLTEGHKLKVTIAFRGRELSHIEVAKATLTTFLSMIGNAKLAGDTSLSGRFLVAMIDRMDKNCESKVLDDEQLAS